MFLSLSFIMYKNFENVSLKFKIKNIFRFTRCLTDMFSKEPLNNAHIFEVIFLYNIFITIYRKKICTL